MNKLNIRQGDTVVVLTGHGKGGRNQELALAAAAGIRGMAGAAVFSVGSDGTDGPTDAAGGYVFSYHRDNPDEGDNYIVDIYRFTMDFDEAGPIGVKSETYLVKIIEYCQEHDIGLFLIVTPYITNEHHELAYNRIKELAAAYGVDFNSTNYDYDEIGLDFSQDFNDGSHLNYWGAQKFTAYLGKELTARFTLPDHRGDPRYASWDDNVTEIETYVEENEGTGIIVW